MRSLATRLQWIICAAVLVACYIFFNYQRWPQSLWEGLLLATGCVIGFFVLVYDESLGWKQYMTERTDGLMTRSTPVFVTAVLLYLYSVTSTASPMAVGISWSLVVGLTLEANSLINDWPKAQKYFSLSFLDIEPYQWRWGVVLSLGVVALLSVVLVL